MRDTADIRPGAPILVTGGAGRVGAHVVEALLARGFEVRVLDDLSSGRASRLPLHDPNLELRTGDVLDAAAVSAAMKGARACVHLAAQPGPVRPGADPYEATLGNVLGFTNVLEAARLHGVGRVVFGSSCAVYGDAPERSARPQPDGPEGMEKLIAEAYAELYARRYGLRTIGLRYPAALAPERAAAATMAALDSDRVGVCDLRTHGAVIPMPLLHDRAARRRLRSTRPPVQVQPAPRSGRGALS